MFCPNCGSKIEPSQKFCIECGLMIPTENKSSTPATDSGYDNTISDNEQNFSYPTSFPNQNQSENEYPASSVAGDYQPQQPESPPMVGYQPQQPESYPIGSYQMPIQNDGFQQQAASQMSSYNPQQSFDQQARAYNGTLPITNNYSPTTEVKTKKPASPKKIIIIAISVLLIIAIGIVAFIFIRKKLAHDYIVNNPTKAAIASYKVYLDENDSDDPIYTLLKNAATQGTLNLNATGAIKSDYNQSNTNIDVKAQYGYDKKAGRYYLKVDGGKLLSTATIGNAASGNGDSTFIEMNLDPEKLFLNYNIASKNGKYYIDNKNFRQDISNSIFSPDNDNVLLFKDKQSFNNFVDAYETAVKQITTKYTEKSALTETIERITKIIETNGNSNVTDGTAIISNGQKTSEISADVITYSFDKNSLKKTLNDIIPELESYLDKTITDSKQKADPKEALKKSFEEAINSFDSNTDNDLKVTIRIYLDKDNHSVIKNEADITGSDKNSDMHFYADFLKAPDNMICAKLTGKDSDGQEKSISAKLVKSDNGTVVKYDLSVDMTSPEPQINMTDVQPAENEPKKQSITASFEYNRSTKKFKATAGSGQNGISVSYTGEADFTEKSMHLKLDDIINNEYMKLSLSIDFSNTAPAAVNTAGAKNYLKLTKQEYDEAFKDMIPYIGGGYTPQPQYNDYSFNYDDYNYSYDENSSAYSQNDVSDYDAAITESLLKTYYSGVSSGTITKDDYPQISVLPNKGASASERKSAADNSTIGDAFDYYYSDYLAEKLSDFCVTEDGNIITKSSQSNTGKEIILSSISVDTKLGDIFNSAV